MRDKNFVFWCQKTIPLVFDNSMSYYECLCKLLNYVNSLTTDVAEIARLQQELQNYVDNYFTNLDVQEEINNKLDELVSNGTISRLLGQYRDYVHIKELGAIGDGITDNSDILQEIFNQYRNIYIDEGTYYFSNQLVINSNTNITGIGTLKGNLEISGSIGETINYTTLDINKINSDYTFNINDLLLIFYEETDDLSNNKRQTVVTSSIDGKLSNNLCNYNNNYSIRKISSKNNIKITNITINGNIIIKYAQDIFIDKIKFNDGIFPISYSYNININDSIINLGNDKRIDVRAGSSNITFNNLKFLSGNTSSDNSALKLNEVFYSYVNNCNFGAPNNEIEGFTGFFHGLMIDGNFTEDNYPNNPSQFINCSNCNVANGYYTSYYITTAKHINLTNISGEKIQIKNSEDVSINFANIKNFVNEIDNEDLKISNSNIDSITEGSRKNMSLINCIINDIAFAQNTNNNSLINCKINKLRNTYISNDSANNITLDNCEIFEQCQLSGINSCYGNIKSHVRVEVNQLNNSNVFIDIIDNATSSSNNLTLQNSVNNFIKYRIKEEIKATTPVNNLLNGLLNKLESINLINSNNNDNNSTQSILKSNNIPTTGKHYKGEIIFNSNPTSDGTIGWICITSGTPGVWKRWGKIEA